MKVRSVALVLAACFSTGCAHAPATPQEAAQPHAGGPVSQELRSSRGGRVRVEPDRVWSSGGSAAREQGRLRGRLLGMELDVGYDAQHVQGLLDHKPVALSLEEHPGGLRVEGGLGGRAVSLTSDARGVRGRVAGCAWELERRGSALVGRSNCDAGLAQPLVLAYPEAMEGLHAAEQATLLGVLLALSPARPGMLVSPADKDPMEEQKVSIIKPATTLPSGK